MSGSRRLVFAIVAAMGLTVAFSVLADDFARAADEAVVKEVVVAANHAPEAIRASEAQVLAPALVAPPATPVRPKAVRGAVRASPARPAVAPKQHWNCSDYWCGRQFVLMLGVGY
jgi:hypothetical protein